MNDSGWIILLRKILEWRWYSDINTCRLFIHMLLIANWKEGEFRDITVPRGSFVSSVSKLAEETGLTIDEVRTAILHLISTNEITKQSTNKYTVFTVVNYNLYQDVPEQEVTQSPTSAQSVPILFPTIKQKGTNITREQLSNSFCSEPENSAQSPSGILLLLNDKTSYNVPVEKITLWKETYPAVDIEQELRRMAAWLDCNPQRRKTRRGINRFINSWLAREQDRGGSKGQKEVSMVTDAMSNLLDTVGQFMAAITGQKTYTRAIRQTTAALKDQNKAQNKQLSSLDKLNNLTSDKGNADNGGAGQMFEEVPITKKYFKLAEVIEDLKEHIKRIIKDFSVGDFFQAGKDISSLAVGIFNLFAKTIDRVNWFGIGRKIGDFLAGLDWFSILKSVGCVVWEAFKAVLEVYAGAFASAPFEATLISLATIPRIFNKITSTKFITGFKKLGTVLKNSLCEIWGGFKDKNISAGFSRALENIRNNLTQFQKFSIGALGVAGEFALVKNGFKEIEIGSDNLVASLGKIAGGAGIAVAALKLICLSNPFTAVIVGATGLAGAIMGINEARKEAFENLAESEELEAFGEKLSNITTRLNESAQATKDRMAASMEYVQNAGVGEMQMAKDLADRYFDLYEKENLTNEETEEMQRLAQLLIEKAPELNQYYDEQTGLINGTRDAINDVIDARLREIQLNAISEELTEAYKKRREALKDVEEAANTAADAQEELSRLQNEYNDLTSRMYAEIAYEDIGVLLSQGVEKLDRATASQDLLNTLAKAGVDETEDLVELYGQLYDIATKFDTEEMVYLPKAAEDLYDIEKLYDVFLLKHKEALDTLENSKSAYDTVETTISDLSQMMSEGMQGVGEDFGEGYEKGILSKVKEVEDAAENIGKSGIESLRKAQDSNSPSKETMKLGEDFVEGYNKGIYDNIFSTQNVVSNYISQIVKKFSGLIPLLYNVGKSSMSSFLDGIISMENRLYQKLNEITRNISVAMANLSIGTAATFGGAINTGFSMYGIENVPVISSEIPRLATGTVIPANREFLAVLGDQKHGTNIEAPLDTIKQANEEAILNVFSKLGISAGNNRSSGNETFVFQVDGETFFKIMRKHAQEYFNSTGNSAFPI